MDIYGNKTKYKASCGNDSVTVNKCPGKTNEECLKVINNTYLVCMMNINFHKLLFLQFYLSLENSLCKDYLTEKFWKILPYNVIPIVLNGVNMTSIAPPHSYIDIKDFPNFHGKKFLYLNSYIL